MWQAFCPIWRLLPLLAQCEVWRYTSLALHQSLSWSCSPPFVAYPAMTSLRGSSSDLFTWPQAVPSELREHVCQWGGPVAHSLPLEHNLTVHISNPDDPDAALFLPIKSIDAYRPHGNAWVPGSPVQCVHVNLAAPAGGGNYRFQYPGPAQFQWFPGFLGQLTLNGDTATASNIIRL